MRQAAEPEPKTRRDRRRQREQLKKTTEVKSSSSYDDYIYLQETAQQDTVLTCIGDIDATTNVMDEYQFKALKHRSQEIMELEPSRATLKTLQSNLTVKGKFTATLRNKN